MKKTKPTTPAAQAKVEALSDGLKVEASPMFGLPRSNRKAQAFAGPFGNAVVFKLDGSRAVSKWSDFGKAALAAQRRAK